MDNFPKLKVAMLNLVLAKFSLEGLELIKQANLPKEVEDEYAKAFLEFGVAIEVIEIKGGENG